MAIAKLTSKYQITIPTEIRHQLALQAGDRVAIELDGDRAVIRPIHGGHTARLRGLGKTVWKKLEGGESWLEQERQTWEGE
jgi:AbrB family looped-hinge helix DNA binding protein